MNKKYFQKATATLLALMLFALMNISTAQAQEDEGPQGYCVPGPDFVPGNQALGSHELLWCYPLYLPALSSYYDWYFNVGIHRTQIHTMDGELIFERNSPSVQTGQNSDAFEHCYVYTGAKAELLPGETYVVSVTRHNSYYSYNGTDYCALYGYSNYYTMRLFIDWNMDADFADAGEWINQTEANAYPAPGANPCNWYCSTSGNYGPWWDYRPCGILDTYKYKITVPADIPIGVTRMRANVSYYYPQPYSAAPGDRTNACWQGYLYNYPGYGLYGFNYGEAEDYLLSFALPFRNVFPSNKEPDNLLYAGELYNGQTRRIISPLGEEVDHLFKQPMVELGSIQEAGTKMEYMIRGPLPSWDVVYRAIDASGNNIFDIGQTPSVFVEMNHATGDFAEANGAVKFPNGGEYQVVLRHYKPGETDFKEALYNFTVSWPNDLAAIGILSPRTNDWPFFKKYTRGLTTPLQIEIQNVGLNPIHRFSWDVRIYNSDGDLEGQPRTGIWDTSNVGQYSIPAGTKVILDQSLMGYLTINFPDEYEIVVLLELLSSEDYEEYNDRFPRIDAPPFTFEIQDEIEGQALSIIKPAPGEVIRAGRPFIPIGEFRNNGVGDISDAPSWMRITTPSGQVIELLPTPKGVIEDVPSGRYNVRSQTYELVDLSETGTYTVEIEIAASGDLIPGNNKVTSTFSVVAGLQGTYTIGATGHYKTIEEATDDLYYKGMQGSVEFIFIDQVYNVNSLTMTDPAWSLAGTILGLGYNEADGTYNTLTWRPSDALKTTRGGVTINLNSGNGQGVFIGQSVEKLNPNSIIYEYLGADYVRLYANFGGYMTFDGGPNKALRFVLNSGSSAHGSAFYLTRGSENISIKNVIIENGKPALANDGFFFQTDTIVVNNNPVSYSAGIVNRSTLYYDSRIFEFPEGVEGNVERVNFNLDTLTNKNNVFEGNEISGFGYGIVSIGMGPLVKAGRYEAYYNENNLIKNNTIYNVTRAGIYLGFEDGTDIVGNKIYNVTGNAGTDAAGIIAGSGYNTDMFGYNNVELFISGNEISNVNASGFSRGILIEQSQNRYVSLIDQGFELFPHKAENIAVINNAIYDIYTKNVNTHRAGVHVLTRRDIEVADPMTRLVTPQYGDYSMDNILVANNTIILPKDDFVNNGLMSGIGIQQGQNLEIYNNAIAILDDEFSGNVEVASGLFINGMMEGSIVSDNNVFYMLGNNSSVARLIETDNNGRNIVELGYQDEFNTLLQWQMWTGFDNNSISGIDFTQDLVFTGSNPKWMNVRGGTRGSILTNRGLNLDAVEFDMHGNTRGTANERYDIGAIEFNGAMFGRDAELLTILSPGGYRATAPNLFSEAEYVMTEAPVEVTARLRNNGSIDLTEVPVKVTISRQTPTGEFAEVQSKTVQVNLGDGLDDDDFMPKSYMDLGGYTVSEQFYGMQGNVTPVYRITITAEMGSDEMNLNNSYHKDVRFYMQRSPIKLMVSNANYVAGVEGANVDQLAQFLNNAAVADGLKKLGWWNDLGEKRINIDNFNRAGWEPRNVNYAINRTLIWTDGHEHSLTRYEKNGINDYLAAGSPFEKKNMLIGSQEMVRNNTSDFTAATLRAESRFPHTPLGVNNNDYSDKWVQGVAVSRDFKVQIKGTGVAGDMYPVPGLMRVADGDGLARIAYQYLTVENQENEDIPVEGRIMGMTATTLSRNVVTLVVTLGLDWRHFGDIENVFRGSFDFMESNGGTIVPVELLAFNAEANGKRVFLDWTSASEYSEYNTSKYDVERSRDGGVFTKIEEVAAAGNSSSERHYGPVIDADVNYGSAYTYRLKMWDVDGEYDYSPERIVTLSMTGGMSISEVMPNPVRNMSEISFNLTDAGRVTMSIVDMSGRTISEIANGTFSAGEHKVNINADELASGAYTIVLRNGDKVLTQTMNVIK